MYLSFLYSILLHIFLTIFVMFGVDYSHNKQPQEETILLELMPIDLITNIKTTTSSNNFDKNKPLESTEKIEQSSVRQNKNDNKTEGMSAIKERLKDQLAAKNPAEKKLIPKQKTDTKEEEIKSEKLPTPKKIQSKEEKQPVKEVKKSPDKTTRSDKKNTQSKSDPDEDLANAVLKSLEEGGKEKVKKKQNLNDLMENAIKGDTTEDYNPEGDLSMSEVALIRSQITKAWRVGAFSGGKDNRQLRVVIKIILEPTGEIKDIKIDKKRPEVVSPRIYDAFVDSVLRAVRLAAPLQNLPPDKFETWQEMELVFDSSGMIY